MGVRASLHRLAAGPVATWAAAILALAAVAVAVRWGTFVAGGSDSYCYLGQARMWAEGSLLRPLDPGFTPPWPDATLSLAPTGFVPSPAVPGGIAPICPPGLAVAMAGAELVAGPRGALAVVPLCAGLVVWCAFVLGRRLAGDAAGLLGAGLSLASPIFLVQAVQPMSDVPASAAWLAALALAAAGTSASAAGAGLSTGLALLIRPNLLPLVVPVGVLALLASGGPEALSRRARVIRGALFAAGVVPGALGAAGLQWLVYGSPARSGYGDPSALFSLSNIAPNLERYPRWLLETHSPWVLLGLAAPFVLGVLARAPSPGLKARGSVEPAISRRTRRRLAGACLATLLVLLATYLPYVAFEVESWAYLRFLLPGVILLIVKASAVTADLAGRLPVPWRAILLLVAGAGLAHAWVRVAHERHVFDLRDSERRFVEAATWVDRALPRSAVVLSVWHSGSVRFYGHRLSVVWDALPADGLDSAIAYLARIGRPPYVLLESWEVERFRERFRGAGALGALDWPPRAQIGRGIVVFDPADRARYFAGGAVPTERVWTAAERRTRRRSR